MKDFEENIIKFIENNIDEYDEIHISSYLSKEIINFHNFLVYDGEQDIVGDTYIGKMVLKNKTIKVFYNILYEYDDIEFKKNEEEYDK